MRPKLEGPSNQAENARQISVIWEHRVQGPLSAHNTTLRMFTREKRRCGNQSPSWDKIKGLSKLIRIALNMIRGLDDGEWGSCWQINLHISPAEKGYAVQGSLFNGKGNMLIRWKAECLVCVCVYTELEMKNHRKTPKLAGRPCTQWYKGGIFLFLFLFLLFRAAPAAYGNSQARGPNRSYSCHSHSSSGSKPLLWPTPHS